MFRLSGLVIGRARFAAAEVWGAPEPRRYRLRGTRSLDVVLRHGTRDLDIFEEIFVRRVYRPPAAPARALRTGDRGNGLQIVDLGGHVGLFGVWCLAHWPQSVISSYEPDPSSFEILRRVARLDGNGRWSAIHAAASNSEGETPFVADGTSEAHIAAEIEHPTLRVPRVDVLERLAAGTVDLLKVDIEGGEWDLLTDPRFAGCCARVVVIEHHGRHCPSPRPRTAAVRLLREAGYEVFAVADEHLGLGTLWAVRGGSEASGGVSGSVGRRACDGWYPTFE